MTREEAIANLNTIMFAYIEPPPTKEQIKIINDTFDMAIKALEQEPKTGRWIDNNEGSLYCSFCGCGALYDKVYPGESVFGKAIRAKSTFCPTCGAKMAESEDK